jgi:hypothetical protein
MFTKRTALISITGIFLLTGLFSCSSTVSSSSATSKLSEKGIPEGYTFAVWAQETLKVTEPVNVAYGAKGKFAFKYNVSQDIRCHNSVFGDPIKGVRKKCYIQKVK